MKAEPEGSSMHYLVHYAGWNVRYDEWITKERIMSVVELEKPGSVERQNSKSAVSALSSNKSSGKVRWFLPPATKLGQGNIFRSVCQQFCPQGGHAWLLVGGACVVAPGGHAWFYSGGMHGFIRGACVVLFGGACVVFSVFSDTMRYGQWAGGTHPTGMHSC